MALSKEDLANIERLFSGKFDAIDSRFDAIDSRFDSLESKLESKIDRVETRLLFSIELLQCDGFGTLEDHERRIRKLEKIQTS